MCGRNVQPKSTALVSSGNRGSFARYPRSIADYEPANFIPTALVPQTREFSLTCEVLFGELEILDREVPL
jgi:hypothetical protein